MKRAKRLTLGGAVEPYLYLLPALLLLTAFIYYPFFKNIFESFFVVDMLGKIKRWCGFENYQLLFQNVKFVRAMKNTVLYTCVTAPVSIAMGLFLALLARKRRRLSAFYEASYALPMAFCTSIIAMVYQLMLNPSLGVINKIFHLDINWLSNEGLTLWVLMFIQVWLNTGSTFLYMLAGLRNIPDEVLESANLDGAHGFSRLFRIIIPMVSPTIMFLLCTSIARGMMAAGLTMILTQGGPNGSTETIVSFIYYQAIKNRNFNAGYPAATIGFLLSFSMILASFLYEKKGVHYN